MNNYLDKDPVIPYYGNMLDNEIIASNIAIVDEDLVMKYQGVNESQVVIDDIIMASTITDDPCDFSFETETYSETEVSNFILIEEESIELER